MILGDFPNSLCSFSYSPTKTPNSSWYCFPATHKQIAPSSNVWHECPIPTVAATKFAWHVGDENSDETEIETKFVRTSTERNQTNVWQTTRKSKGNNFTTRWRENQSTQHNITTESCSVIMKPSRHPAQKKGKLHVWQAQRPGIRQSMCWTASVACAETHIAETKLANWPGGNVEDMTPNVANCIGSKYRDQELSRHTHNCTGCTRRN